MSDVQFQGNTDRVRFAQGGFARHGGRNRAGGGRTKEMKQLHDEVIANYVAVESGNCSTCIRIPKALMRALAARSDRTGQSSEGQIRVLLAMLCAGRIRVLKPDGTLYAMRGVRHEASELLGLEFQERQAAYSAGEGGQDMAAMMPLKTGISGEYLSCSTTSKKIGSAS